MKALRSRLQPALCVTAIVSAACASSAPPTSEPMMLLETPGQQRQQPAVDSSREAGTQAVETPAEVATTAAEESPASEVVSADSVSADSEASAAATSNAEPIVEEDLSDTSPEVQLEEALEAYESSRIFWQQGSFDDAFAALDRAYELMTSVYVEDDSLLSQQKEDLRHLISRRIVDIYASRRTVVRDLSAEIPLTINEDVQREIERFQGPERDFFLQSYERSGLYRPMILAKLAEAGMPDDLSWLPLVESGFKVKALSRARALGLWQFIASTGYRYDLHRTDWVDERMDPEKATTAALGYLSDLHGMFGEWTTALAGYNCGEHNVQRQIRSQKEGYFDHFWDLYAFLPRETRRYVPRFLATLAIVKDPASYGMELPEPLPPLRFETIEVQRSVALSAADKALALDKGVLANLNPELRHGATPNSLYTLKVPVGQGQALIASFDTLPKWSSGSGFGVHRVRSGETLSQIASRYSTSVGELTRLNDLRSAHRIWPGQRLTVRASSRAARVASTPVAAGGTVSYSVRRGDTLYSIAKRLAVPLDELLRVNSLSRRSTIYPGQTLRSP